MEVVDDKQLFIIPQDILANFYALKNYKSISYRTNFFSAGEYCELPWTISPFFLKSCYSNAPMNKDLTNPQAGDNVLPNAQLWKKQCKYRLSEDSRRTDDSFYSVEKKKCNSLIYDGINKHGKAICGCNYNSDEHNVAYDLYLFTQSNDFGRTTKTLDYKPSSTGEGILRSLMLDNEDNNFVYSVDCGNSLYQLIRQNIIESDRDVSREGCVYTIVSQTKELFIKTVCLGKNTYLGITETGKLYSLWLNNHNKFQYAEQKFLIYPHTFKDISVDNVVSTKNGFKQKIALLTTKGEIYVVHFDACVNGKLTLFYIMTVENVDNVKRLFYRDGNLSIIYKDEKNIFLWDDNFELLYLCALLKKQYNDSF